MPGENPWAAWKRHRETTPRAATSAGSAESPPLLWHSVFVGTRVVPVVVLAGPGDPLSRLAGFLGGLGDTATAVGLGGALAVTRPAPWRRLVGPSGLQSSPAPLFGGVLRGGGPLTLRTGHLPRWSSQPRVMIPLQKRPKN